MPHETSLKVISPVKSTFDPRSTKQWVLNDDISFQLDEEDQPSNHPILCSKCHQLPVSPNISRCSIQLVCCRCISLSGGVCPSCKTKDCLSSDIGGFRSQIESFTMTCPYDDCGASFSLLHFMSHLRECRRATFICGCGDTFESCDEDYHYPRCPLRPVPCSFCPHHYHFKDMTEHVQCTHPKCIHCGLHHSPDDQQHTPGPCPVSGCVELVPPCYLAEHLKDRHSLRLLTDNTRLQQEVRELKLLLQAQRESYEGKLEAIKVRLSTLLSLNPYARLALQVTTKTGGAPEPKSFQVRYDDTHESRLQSSRFAVAKLRESFQAPLQDLVEHDQGTVAFCGLWDNAEHNGTGYRIVDVPHGPHDPGAWVGPAGNPHPDVVITFPEPVAVCGVAIAGRCKSKWAFQYVTRVRVEYWAEGFWSPVSVGSGELAGPRHAPPDDMRLIVHVFPAWLVTRRVRITVVAYNSHPCMRFGVFGWK